MDIFGRKRIAQLEQANANLNRRLKQWENGSKETETKLRNALNRIEYLVRTIRDMDQEIFNMGQKTDWSAQRPHFLKLHDEMTARKVEESKRIGDMIRGEIIDTYSNPKRIGHG